MSNQFNAEQARENLKLAKPDYQEIYPKILKAVDHFSKEGINPVVLNFKISTISQENMDEMMDKLSNLGFNSVIKKNSPSSISVEVGF